MKRGSSNNSGHLTGHKRYCVSSNDNNSFSTNNSPSTSYASRIRTASTSGNNLASQLTLNNTNNSNYAQKSGLYLNQLNNYQNNQQQSVGYGNNSNNLNLQQNSANYGNTSHDPTSASFNNAVAYMNYYQAYSAAAAAESYGNHGLMDTNNYTWPPPPPIHPSAEFLSQPPPPPPPNNSMSTPSPRGRSFAARGGRGGSGAGQPRGSGIAPQPRGSGVTPQPRGSGVAPQPRGSGATPQPRGSGVAQPPRGGGVGPTRGGGRGNLSSNQNASAGMNSNKKPQPQENFNLSGFMESDLQDVGRVGITINKKSKRKPMSSHYTSKEWNREDALRALTVEREIHHSEEKVPTLILKFPDEELNKEIVKGFSPFIDNVHFQQPSTPRYCFVQLKKEANVNEAIESISKIKFGTGTICAEHKIVSVDQEDVSPEDIDPYTLYVGNLPTNVKVQKVKSKFPNAVRIDIGFAQRMKFTRYAFVRYDSIEESIAALRATYNMELNSRSLVVRFRRNKGNVGSSMPIEIAQQTKYQNFDHIQEDEISTPSVDNVETVSDTCSLNSEALDVEVDSKANVLADAHRLMELAKKSTAASTSTTVTTPVVTVANESNSTKTSESLSQPTVPNEVTIKVERDTGYPDVSLQMPVCLLGTKIKQEEVEVNQFPVCDNTPDSDEEFFNGLSDDSNYEEESRITNNFMVDDEDEDYHYWERTMLPEIKREIDDTTNKHEQGDVKKIQIVQNTSQVKADVDQVKQTGSVSDDAELDSLFDELNPDDGFQF